MAFLFCYVCAPLRRTAMIDFGNAVIRALIVHYIGRKNEDEGVVLSQHETTVDDKATNKKLVDFFAKPFAKRDDYHCFIHPSEDVNLNACYTFCKEVFTNQAALTASSHKIAKHLYDTSGHANIKEGELIVVVFDNLVQNGAPCNGLGLYKSESKDTLLKVVLQNDNYALTSETGIGSGNIEKSCLVLNTNAEQGFLNLINDHSKTAGEEAVFWRDTFLKVAPLASDYYFTNNYLKLTTGFIKNKLAEDTTVTRADQVEMLNRSVQYFKDNEQFKLAEFSTEVFKSQETVKAFAEYKQEIFLDPNLNAVDSFDISESAVKRQKKYFRGVIKLDKNFHLYVHGGADQMERGYDEERNLNYYKIYFREES
ncbi:MAG: nucleoid-associated protein [Chitinophagales bacterium]